MQVRILIQKALTPSQTIVESKKVLGIPYLLQLVQSAQLFRRIISNWPLISMCIIDIDGKDTVAETGGLLLSEGVDDCVVKVG
jgi:hypothetical protein